MRNRKKKARPGKNAVFLYFCSRRDRHIRGFFIIPPQNPKTPAPLPGAAVRGAANFNMEVFLCLLRQKCFPN